ncbi:MAG: amino acid ABC transporter ATP-binding protein [Actinobacteria bacterium]|nr:amino acid ABC transporter ATP-binding protein [Actinomycetota bacterium]
MAEQAAPSPRLQLDGVHKRFGPKHVLSGIDLTVREHEVVCLIGPSGCGKSTLLRCVDLLERIERGRILLDGRDITARGVDANAVRKRMAIVFQSFNLFPHLSVLDNVTLAPRKAHGVRRAEAEATARELLGRFGLAEKADEYPERLSGGQQQRAAIVRALTIDPDLLLLDEVTSALDPELVGEVLAVIRELAASGMTMVLATHEMGFARDVADRVCFLHEGRVLESGPPAQVLIEPTQERTRQFLSRIIDAGRL